MGRDAAHCQAVQVPIQPQTGYHQFPDLKNKDAIGDNSETAMTSCIYTKV